MFSKNKLIKVVSAFFYLFIFSAAKIFSFSFNDFMDFLDLEFSFKSDVSMSSNILYEKVFENGTKASELRWMGFSPVISVGLETLINSSYYLGFSISSSIPTQIGNVTDKDFFINEKNNISKYSEHNVITDKDYCLSLDSFYVFSLPFSKIDFMLGISGLYSNLKMETDDGYLQYPSGNMAWTGNEEKEYINGTAVSYEQSRIFAGFGFGISSKKESLRYFTFSLMGYCYPIVYISAIDNHFLRLTQFCDLMNKGFSARLKGDITLRISKKFALYTNLIFTFATASGSTYTNSIGLITQNTTESSSYTASTLYFNPMVTLGFKFIF